MAGKVKLGLIQPPGKLGDVPYNLAQGAKLCREAAEQGANILCLPELFNVGYHLGYLGNKTVTLAIEYFDQTVACFSALAQETKTYIICPLGEPSECTGVIYNSALLFNPDGEIAGRYAKSHLWALEKQYFKDGNRLPVFDTEFGRIGILICYDIGFPEAARAMCLQGVELLLVPSAWCIQDQDMWDRNLPQRALENIFFVAGVNAVLDQQGLNLFGHSRVFNPRGHLVAEIGEQTGYCLVEIDLSDVMTQRNEITYLHDRKPHLYHSVVEQR